MTEEKTDFSNEPNWIDNNVPVSGRFDDPYYSRTDGLAESRHVFINGNNLEDRWQKLPAITIAELGFGTGLNFLATVAAFQVTAPHDARLEFVSFEQFPLPASALRTALSQWPELATSSARLSEFWADISPNDMGAVELDWCNKVHLTIHFGDANLSLPLQSFLADAWYLDGFSPARNPELWNTDLMKAVYDHTRPGGTFATYSAAGWIRRNLANAGFEVTRVRGYSGKRQMSIGQKPLM